MGQQIIARLLPLLEKINWPTTEAATEQGRQSFLVGLEKVDDYSGDPTQLTAALKTFVTGGSLPFAYAGVAYTLIAASEEKDGSYDAGGLEAAMDWPPMNEKRAASLVAAWKGRWISCKRLWM